MKKQIRKKPSTSTSGKNKTAVQAKSIEPPDSGIHFTIQQKAKFSPTEMKLKTKEKHKKLNEVLAHQKEYVFGNSKTGNTRFAHGEKTIVDGGAVTDHIIPGKFIEEKIIALFKAEKKSNDKLPLENFLGGLVEHISPSHESIDDMPNRENYVRKVEIKHSKAASALKKIKVLAAGDIERKKLAFKIAIDVIKSPVNSMTGDIAPKLSAKANKHSGPLSVTSSLLKPKGVGSRGSSGKTGKLRTSSGMK